MRPVVPRASLQAWSIASLPVTAGQVTSSRPGVVRASVSASRAFASLKWNSEPKSSLRSASDIAATSAGWRWPSACTPPTPQRSRKRRPSVSVTYGPSPDASTIRYPSFSIAATRPRPK